MVTLTNEDDNYNQDGGGNQKPDTINALGGDDIILTSTLGGSLVLGGDGNDSLKSQGPSGVGNIGLSDTVEGGSGDDTLEFTAAGGFGFGDADNDSLVTASRTSLYGGAGDDFLRGLLGENWFSANEGDDTILIGKRDSIYGGKGSDTISLSTDNKLPDNLDLQNFPQNLSSITADDRGDRNFISANRDTDLVVAWGERDTIYGGKDDDTLYSFGSQVRVSGDKGDDTIVNRTTTAVTSIERSTLLGGEGNDSIEAGVVLAGDGRNYVDGGAGNDTLRGQGAKDTLIGGAGDDSIVVTIFNGGSSGTNLLDGGAGKDILVAASTTDKMIGGQGNDSLYGTFSQGDGGAGNDTINATGANIIGDVAKITLIGGAGNDSLLGSTNTNVSNFFNGGTGNDFIQFGTANDKLIGDQEGNDTIVPEVQLESNTSTTLLIEDTLGSNTLSGGLGDDTLVTGAGDDSIAGDATSAGGEGGEDSIVAGAGNDIIFGRAGRDTIIGGAGDDYIAAGLNGTGDSLIGGEGDDSFVFFAATDETKNSVIVDFDTTDDRILLSDKGFGLVNSEAGSVIRNADFLAIDPGKNYNNDAQSTNPTIIYERQPLDDKNEKIDSGLLKYDPSGNGGEDLSDVIIIARLNGTSNGTPNVLTSDIFII